MALNYVSLTCDLYDGAGSTVNGGIATFTPSAQLTDTADHEIITGAGITGSFGPVASPVVRLLATDNAAPLPSGWAWNVTFTGVPGNPGAFSFFLPYSGGASQYLSSLSPLPAGTTSLLSENAQQLLAEG
jgi:hypothetical protein